MRLLSAILLLCVCARAQDPAPVVVAVRFEGNERYDAAFLREQIATKAGQPLDRGLLTRDERVLQAYFAAVLEIKEVAVDGGVEVVFEVLDSLVVGKVEVVGSFVSESDYRPLMSTRTRRPLLDYSLNSDKRLLERLHREKGHAFVSVQVIRRETKLPKTQDVVFSVIADRKVQVVEVILEGARSLKPSKLLDAMRSPSKKAKRKHWSTLKHILLTPLKPIGNLLDETTYRKETVEADRARLERYYRDEGFRDAQVVLVRTGFNATRTEATVHYRIVEGRRYVVRALEVEYADGGEPKAADAEYLAPSALKALAALAPGQPYRTADLAQTQRSLNERLWSRAYAQSTIDIIATPATKAAEMDLKFIIRAGEKVRLGELRIYGNRWTKDNVIRRQFRDGAQPGDYLDVESLLAAQQRLSQLQYFQFVRFARNRQWGLIKSANAERPDEYDVEIELEELDSTRQFQIGGAIDTDGGATAQLDITWTNFDIGRPPDRIWDLFEPGVFRGAGQEFTISLAPGTRNSYFAIVFADPAVLDSPWSMHVNFFRTLSDSSPDYDLVVDGAAITVGRFLDRARKWRLVVEWSLRQVLLHNPAPDAPVNAIDEQGHSTLHGVKLTVVRENRREADPFLNGYVTRISAQMFGGVLGGDVDVVKLSLNQYAGWKLFRTSRGHHRIKVSLLADWADAFADTGQVPIYERYFLGGRNLRGFEFREVGPRSNDRPTGGEFMVRVSTEYTIPIVDGEEGLGLDLVLFVDQGGIAEFPEGWNGDVWRISAGFAFAVSFQIAGRRQPPLMIEFGFPIRSRPGDREQLVSISFAGRF